MRYVILRDDDTNALTPVECLERMYRPFLDRNLPVNLAVIPDVATDATTPDGQPEGFLTASYHADDRIVKGTAFISPSPPRSGGLEPFGKRRKECAEHRPERAERAGASESLGRGEVALRIHGENSATSMLDVRCSAFDVPKSSRLPISTNSSLVQYLRDHSGYHIVQHGCHHDYFEFDRHSPDEISRRLDHGTRLLCEAGFCKPDTFVAPHDKFSPAAYREVQKRFRVISSGWFEWRRIPSTWRLNYIDRKIRRAPHWRVGDTTLLSHPGCLLSWRRPYASMLDEITREIQRRKLTVLVTHWWEYFRDGQSDEAFITRLHEVAEYLAVQKDIRVVSFSDVAEGKVPLN